MNLAAYGVALQARLGSVPEKVDCASHEKLGEFLFGQCKARKKSLELTQTADTGAYTTRRRMSLGHFGALESAKAAIRQEDSRYFGLSEQERESVEEALFEQHCGVVKSLSKYKRTDGTEDYVPRKGSMKWTT